MDPSQGARRAVPELTLQEYVTCRTELELWPEHRAYFHGKYKVESEAVYQEIVRRWEGQLATSPHIRAQADAICASCLEHACTMERARSGGA